MTTPAPDPVVPDSALHVAAQSIGQLAVLYQNMGIAAQALTQVASLGQAIDERQAKLNSMDTDIAANQARLDALHSDVANMVAYGEQIIAESRTTAVQTLSDAQDKANALIVAAEAQAATINNNATEGAASAIAQATAKVQDMTNQTATMQANLDALATQRDQLQGQISDFETKLALSRQNLAQLLGSGGTQ